ncbi:cytosine/adenosine deaminase-related metal-dependent hydrolase [Arthrobacter globiformis]|nr:cytosine/adenosine deaminase-related metal-dependent hydrolase [Arthrobacter globiformis]
MTQLFDLPPTHPAAESRLWIRNPLAAFTANSLDASGGLVVSGGRIVEVLGAGQTPSVPCQQTFDAGNHVLLPGLINTHHHFYQTLTRAWGPVANAPLFPWLQNLYPVWARLTPRDLELAATVALAELLLSGCTTAADHHYLFPAGMEDAVDVEIGVVRRLGMRGTLTRGSMTLGEDDGGLAAAVDSAGAGGGAGRQRTADPRIPRARGRCRDPDCAGALLAVFRHQGDHGRERRAGRAA